VEAALDPNRDVAAPRSRDGLGLGAVLALLVHGLLIVAIAFGVSWRTREPDGVVAELWSAVPQVAAPRATSPPPTPTPTPPRVAEPPRPTPPATDTTRVADAQIAIEKARRESEAREAERRELEAKRQAAREEAERAEREKAKQKAAADEAKRELAAKEAEAQKKKEAADKQRQEVALAAQRDAFLKRMQGQAAAGGEAGGTAAQTSGPSASYAGRIRARIKPNIVLTDDIAGNPVATVEVRCAPDGTIVSRKLLKSSGVAAWDEAVVRAIDKTEVLPRDVDGRVPSPMQLDFKPRD
jgi:colicin import membrane protein